VVEKIRGAKGTTVRLRVLPEDEGPGGRSKVVKIIRDKIKLEDQAAKKSIIETGSKRVGVIDLPAFYRDFQGFSSGQKDYRSTTRDVKRLIKELESEGVDGIVVDLRSNGGGSLAEATELTGLFIPSGPVVQVKHATGDLEVERDPDPALVYSGPLAVLVNRHSASASEIFAGAIQDYKRGIIIGEPTFGKGTVQTLIDLGRFVRFGDNNLGRLRLTMAQFFRVNGGSTQFKGVVPDIMYPTGSGSDDQGERSLDNALPWASIPAAEFSQGKLKNLTKYRQQHEVRIKDDPGFKYLMQLETLLAEAKDEKMISLDTSVRRQQWKEREDRRKTERDLFRSSIGLAPLSDEEEEKQQKNRSSSRDQDNPETAIMLNEAVNILADYIEGQTRSAMVQ
jgi:carboxyl-terminal processing protease